MDYYRFFPNPYLFTAHDHLPLSRFIIWRHRFEFRRFYQLSHLFVFSFSTLQQPMTVSFHNLTYSQITSKFSYQWTLYNLQLKQRRLIVEDPVLGSVLMTLLYVSIVLENILRLYTRVWTHPVGNVQSGSHLVNLAGVSTLLYLAAAARVFSTHQGRHQTNPHRSFT